MKKILFGLTLAAGLTLTSCSSFLEEPILGQQDMKNCGWLLCLSGMRRLVADL